MAAHSPIGIVEEIDQTTGSPSCDASGDPAGIDAAWALGRSTSMQEAVALVIS